MKLSVCPLVLMLISLFVLQSPKLHANNVLALEYSAGEQQLTGAGFSSSFAAEHYGRRETQKGQPINKNHFDANQNDHPAGVANENYLSNHQQDHPSQQQLLPNHQQLHDHHYYEEKVEIYEYYPGQSVQQQHQQNHQNHNQHLNDPHPHPQNYQYQQHIHPQQVHSQSAPEEAQAHQITSEVQRPPGSPQIQQHQTAQDPQILVSQPQIVQQHQQNNNQRLVLEDLHHRQVMIDKSQQGYRYAHTDIRWRHESTQEGELSAFFMQNIVSSYPTVMTQSQLEYYQYHQHQVHEQHNNQPRTVQQLHSQRHVMYSRHAYEDHDFESAQQYYQNHQAVPTTSCEPIDNPSMLIMPDYSGEPTCGATSAADLGGPLTDSSRNVPNFSQFTNAKPSHNSNVESFPIAPPHYHYESSLMAAIRHYWREVSGLCLASAIFLNWLFVVVKRRFIASGITRAEHAIETIQRSSSSSASTTTKSMTKDTNSGSAHDSAFEENISPMSMNDCDSSSSQSLSVEKDKSTFSLAPTIETPVMRQRSSTLKAEPIPIPLTTSGHNSLSNSLSNTSDYNSRYSSDFDSIQRLGRGGFGIVFEAKNKIDDCHYAVKRICLPLEKEARERVMREVRALAKLDHAGIVRYYNAWLETPPDDWLKQHDAQLGIVHSKDGMSYHSTDGLYDKNESENITKGYGVCGSGGDITGARKLLDSDNSTSLFGKNPFKRRSNGYNNKYLRENSSSPSLDIVFEGSGSIRVESENNSGKTSESNHRRSKTKHKSIRMSNGQNKNNGDNYDSDSEDSDFIQFESKGGNETSSTEVVDNGDDNDWSISSHLTEPFSSSDSELDESSQGDDANNSGMFRLEEGRKNALAHQKEMRRLNNASMSENLQVEKVYLYIQMQLCRKDTLKDWLRTNCETRDKTTVFDLFYQIVDAVEYVHSQDLIHRDLKPSNIFFSLDGTLKIGDFGLCRTKTNANGVGSSLDLQEYVAESDVERGFEAVHTEQVGTQLYMSPEQLSGLSYNQKVDIFAMGLILLELLVPFKTQMQRVNVLFKARNNLYSDEFKFEHPQEHELVRSLLNRSPHKRPTANEIKQHELLASAQLSQPVIERIYHRRRTISSNSSTE